MFSSLWNDGAIQYSSSIAAVYILSAFTVNVAAARGHTKLAKIIIAAIIGTTYIPTRFSRKTHEYSTSYEY